MKTRFVTIKEKENTTQQAILDEVTELDEYDKSNIENVDVQKLLYGETQLDIEASGQDNMP